LIIEFIAYFFVVLLIGVFWFWVAQVHAPKGFLKGLSYVVGLFHVFYVMIMAVVVLGGFLVDYGQPECVWLLNETMHTGGSGNFTETYTYDNSCGTTPPIQYEMVYVIYGWWLFILALVVLGVFLWYLLWLIRGSF
jgi:hypothetical protein